MLRQLLPSLRLAEGLLPGAATGAHLHLGNAAGVLDGPSTSAQQPHHPCPPQAQLPSLRQQYASSSTAAAAATSSSHNASLSGDGRDLSVGSYYELDLARIPEALQPFHQTYYGSRPGKRLRRGGCVGLQEEMKATGQASVMYRQCWHDLFSLVASPDALHHLVSTEGTTPSHDAAGPLPSEAQAALGPARGILLQGPTGTGKSLALAALVEQARRNHWLVMYLPSAAALTRGGYFTKRPKGSTWDTIISAQHLLKSMASNHSQDLQELPQQLGGAGTLLDIVKGGLATTENGAKAVDACLLLRNEMGAVAASGQRQVLFAVDDYNALYWRTEYGEAVHRLKRRELRVEDLTLAAGMRLLGEAGNHLGPAKVVAATSAALATPEGVVPCSSGSIVNFDMPRLDADEVEAAMQYYVGSGLSPQRPTPEYVARLLALTNGNFRELRRLLARNTTYDLRVYN